jgi:hypothetical protein
LKLLWASGNTTIRDFDSFSSAGEIQFELETHGDFQTGELPTRSDFLLLTQEELEADR